MSYTLFSCEVNLRHEALPPGRGAVLSQTQLWQQPEPVLPLKAPCLSEPLMCVILHDMFILQLFKLSFS